MEMPISTDAFRGSDIVSAEPIDDKQVKTELLYRAIGRPVINRLPTLLPLSVIAMAASGIPERMFLWGLILIYSAATFAAAATAGLVKKAIENDRNIKQSLRIWLGVEFAASAIWGLMLLPIADSSLVGPERPIITAVVMVTVAAGSLVSANVIGLSKAIIAGFIATALPASVFFYDNYGAMLVASSFLMFLGLIHLVSMMQKEAVRNLKTELENKQLTSRLAEALDIAQYLSRHDSLTGLLNRRDFETAAKKLRQSHSHSSMAIILLDLDHFKKINDRFGHATGDEVLKAAAGIIKTPVRALHMSAGAQEAVARWGGEEFVIALARTSLEEAKIVAERICLALAQYENSNWPPTLKLTCSIGVATWGDGEELNNAIDQADLAMFKAKSLGRNNVQIAGEQTVETLIGPE